MPRLKGSEPKTDGIKALVLQRKQAIGIRYAELAEKAGISRQKLYTMLNRQSSEEWTIGELKKICRILQIPADEMRGAIKM